MFAREGRRERERRGRPRDIAVRGRLISTGVQLSGTLRVSATPRVCEDKLAPMNANWCPPACLASLRASSVFERLGRRDVPIHRGTPDHPRDLLAPDKRGAGRTDRSRQMVSVPLRGAEEKATR